MQILELILAEYGISSKFSTKEGEKTCQSQTLVANIYSQDKRIKEMIFYSTCMYFYEFPIWKVGK